MRSVWKQGASKADHNIQTSSKGSEFRQSITEKKKSKWMGQLGIKSQRKWLNNKRSETIQGIQTAENIKKQFNTSSMVSPSQ